MPLKQRNTRAGAASDFISPKVTPPVVVRAFVDTAIRTDPTLADWRNEEQFICDSSRVSVPTLVIVPELVIIPELATTPLASRPLPPVPAVTVPILVKKSEPPSNRSERTATPSAAAS